MEQQECSRILQSHAKALWGGNPQPWQEEATWAEHWGDKVPMHQGQSGHCPVSPFFPNAPLGFITSCTKFSSHLILKRAVGGKGAPSQLSSPGAVPSVPGCSGLGLSPRSEEPRG